MHIFPKLYARLVQLRKIIRQKINETFIGLIHENITFIGTAELLNVYSTIIPGL